MRSGPNESNALDEGLGFEVSVGLKYTAINYQ